MEHFRRWGLTQRIREVAHLKVNWSQDVVFCTTQLGHEIMRCTRRFGLSPKQTGEFAESGQQIPQPLVEEVLREAVFDLEWCSPCLGWSLYSLEQHDEVVQATIVSDQGEQRQIEASYVLGCDRRATSEPETRVRTSAWSFGHRDWRSSCLMARLCNTGYSIQPAQASWAVWTWRTCGGPMPMASLPRPVRPILMP